MTRGASTGLVASDYTAIQMLATQHRLTADLGSAAAMGLRAGVDTELPKTVGYGAPLLEARRRRAGSTSALVDVAVERVLRLKFRLGLFERPLVPLPDGDRARPRSPPTRRASHGRSPVARSCSSRTTASCRSARISGAWLFSDRSPTARATSWVTTAIFSTSRRSPRCAQRDNAFGFPVDGRDRGCQDELAGRPTILDAIRARLPGRRRDPCTPGRVSATAATRDIDEAARIAAAADVAIVVLGERSGLTDDATTGEFRDRRDLGFLGRQQELLERVVATGTPVVLVVVSGRPLAIEWAARHCAAILLAWVPGDAGPGAIVDVLVGDENPSGKLPISMPRTVGQVPLSYRHHPTGGRSNWKGPYVDGPTTPLWPFGFGRSYTTFELSNLAVDRGRMSTDGGEVCVEVDVTNTGDRPGDEIVQLYVRDVEATVARPVLELRGFRRVPLEPGERCTVTFILAAEQLAYAGADYRRVIEPGEVMLMVGTSSAELSLSACVTLVGDTVELVERRRYLTRTSVR